MGTRTYDVSDERIAERCGHTTVNTARPPGMTLAERRERAQYRAVEPCHVVVVTEMGRLPGLLSEWRRPHQCPWEGRVALVRPRSGTWVLVLDWLPAGAIERVQPGRHAPT